MTRMILGLVFALAVCALGGIPSDAHAFQVQPGIIDLVLGAGSSTQQVITVKNTDPTPNAYILTTQKFKSGGDGRPEFLDPADVDGLPSWLRTSDREFSLGPGEEKRVVVDIAVPSSTRVGGSYAAVFVTEKPVSTGPLGIARRIATLFLVSINGVPGNVSIDEVTQRVGTMDGRALSLRSKGNTDIRLKNAGRAHDTVEARVRVETFGIFGKHSYDEARTVRLLPDEMRHISVEWSGASPIGFVRSTVALSNGQTARSSRHWYVLPVPLALAGVVGVGLVVIGYSMIKRRQTGRVG